MQRAESPTIAPINKVSWITESVPCCPVLKSVPIYVRAQICAYHMRLSGVSYPWGTLSPIAYSWHWYHPSCLSQIKPTVALLISPFSFHVMMACMQKKEK
ncbi:unnamed protein product [Ilex paraguariensis]|uniref:Uncharacterized protein n=1 Tax=Ilex paraguariensis TaxID=185542 RepID=A0ABC8V5B2_9AQUA